MDMRDSGERGCGKWWGRGDVGDSGEGDVGDGGGEGCGRWWGEGMWEMVGERGCGR